MIKWCSVLSITSMTASFLIVSIAGAESVAGFLFLMGIVLFFITLISFILE